MRSVAAGAAFRVFGSADVHVKGKRLTRDARDLRAGPRTVLSPFRFANFGLFAYLHASAHPWRSPRRPRSSPRRPFLHDSPRARVYAACSEQYLTCTHAFVSWGGPRPLTTHSSSCSSTYSSWTWWPWLHGGSSAVPDTANVPQTYKICVKSARRMHLHVPSCSRKSEDFGVVNTCILLKW
jgi:hypothetical protein